MKPLENKIALVTGAARGIGQAIALQLAADGADLALCDVKTEWLDDTAAKVKALGRRAECYAMDVANGAAVGEAVAKVAADFGRIDVLVNNAGVSHRSTFAETDLEVFQRVMAVNYFGALNCTKAVLPSLIARHGQIIVLSSLSGFAPLLYRSAYNASKHALHGLFETLRYEIKGSGVNVMLVCPGFTATDLRKNALVGDAGLAPSPPLAMGRVASAHDVAEEVYRAALKRKRLLVLSNVNWRARLLARYFPWLFERALLPRISGIKPGRGVR